MRDCHISHLVLDTVRDRWRTGETEIGSDAVYHHLVQAGAFLSPAAIARAVNELEYLRLIRVDRPFNRPSWEAGGVIITWVGSARDEPQRGVLQSRGSLDSAAGIPQAPAAFEEPPATGTWPGEHNV